VALNHEATAELLACGREAAGVWDDAEAGRLDEHERACPHCQAVAADAAGLAHDAAGLAAESVEPPTSLLERVMSVVQAELRSEYLPLPSREGPARLDRATAAAVLRQAADAMSGVWARSCRITPPGQHTPTVADEGQEAPELGPAAGQSSGVVVTMSITVVFGADLPSAAARVQQLVATAGERFLGIPVERVDVTVVDVFEAPVTPVTPVTPVDDEAGE
jgi:hypothetical protein